MRNIFRKFANYSTRTIRTVWYGGCVGYCIAKLDNLTSSSLEWEDIGADDPLESKRTNTHTKKSKGQK